MGGGVQVTRHAAPGHANGAVSAGRASKAVQRLWAVHALGTVFMPPCSPPKETAMATPAERMRAYRERARRGLRRFTISVSADDLSVIAESGYEGAVTTDHDQQAQAVGLFLTRTFHCLRLES